MLNFNNNNMAVGPSSSHPHRRLQVSSVTNSNSNNSIRGTATRTTLTTAAAAAAAATNNAVILGLRNDARYREIMYQQFNILGTTRDAAREEKAAVDLFTMFQREGAQFFRMERNGKRMRLDDEDALKRITRHVKRRTESTHIWLGISNHNKNICRQDDTSSSLLASRSFSSKSTTGKCWENANQEGMCGQCLHKKYDAHSPTRSVMCAPQDPPVSNGNQSSNQLLSPFEFRAEEKKQDDDTMDLEIGYSSSAAYPQDNRSLHFDGSARRPPYVIHHRVRESPGSGIMRDENCTGDCQNDGALSEDNSAPFGLKAVPSNHIVLSLNDEYYKEIMWRHYRILGKTRDSGRELRIGNDVFAIFQQKMGQTGRFFKRAQNQDFEVNDEIALAKIIADIRRRMKNYTKWSGSPQTLAFKPQSLSPSAMAGKLSAQLSPRQLRRENWPEELAHRNENRVSTTLRKRSTRNSTTSETARTIPKPTRDDTILCLSNKKYKEEMLKYYNILGNKQGGGKFKEENVVLQIFQSLKKSMGKGGIFFLKMSRGDLFHPVDDERALQTISRDVKRRHEVIHYWLHHENNGETKHLSHANIASVFLPIAQHHAWRDQLSASPIEVTGNDNFSIPTPQFNTQPVELCTSEPSIPKPNSFLSLRQSIEVHEHYQLCTLGEKLLEEYFQQVGERVVENALHDVFCLDVKKPRNEACILFTDAAQTIRDQLCVREQPDRHTNSSFLRHFQSNAMRLAELPNRMNRMRDNELSVLRLSCDVKRVKVGSKDRVLCMVIDCEKHAQTRCNGCCTAHFRLLNSFTGTERKQHLPSIKYDTLDVLFPSMKEDSSPDKESMAEIPPPSQKSIGFEPLQVGTLNSGANEVPGEECREISFINQINTSLQSPGEEYTAADPFGHNTTTLLPKQHIYPGSDSKLSAQSSMITISPITTTQTVQFFNPGMSLQNHVQQRIGFASLSGSLDCLECPGAEASCKNSPIAVQAVNTLPPKNSAGVNSAFTSPARIGRPPLSHQLYRPSDTSSKRVQFPGIRSAREIPLQSNRFETEQPLPLRSCLHASTVVRAKTEVNKNAGTEKDVLTTKRKSKRISQSMPSSDDLDSSHSFPSSHADQSKSALCHCPICSKGNLNVQGMYAHFGRAHNGTLPWQEVKFSCPFCLTVPVSRARHFGSFRDLQIHVNAKHPGCAVVGPHPSKLLSASLKVNHSSSNTEAIQNNARVLRVRKAASDGSSKSSGLCQLRGKDPEVVATKQSFRSWSKLVYPNNYKDISIIEEQRRLQEEIVEGAREQRMKLCRNEAEMESKRFEEERLAYLRGIRERTRLADGERIEKQKFTEKADQLMMLYQYENRNRKRSREEVEFDKLCARPVFFCNETTRLMAREGKSCTDDQCQFCNDDNVQITERENEDLAKGLVSENQSHLQVLLPSFRVVEDVFSLSAGADVVREDASMASAEMRSAVSRRAISTAKRVKIEEDKLLMLKDTKHCLEFIKKYNGGMILNAWSGTRKEYKNRKIIA